MWYAYSNEDFWSRGIFTDELQNYYCAYVGAFGEFSCNPRTLGSSHLNRMISLEGIVTKCSLVRPKVIQSVHYNERKDRFVARRYRDQTMTTTGITNMNVYPQEDDEKNPVCHRRKSLNWTAIADDFVFRLSS